MFFCGDSQKNIPSLIPTLKRLDSTEPWRNQFRFRFEDYPRSSIARLASKFFHSSPKRSRQSSIYIHQLLLCRSSHKFISLAFLYTSTAIWFQYPGLPHVTHLPKLPLQPTCRPIQIHRSSSRLLFIREIASPRNDSR